MSSIPLRKFPLALASLCLIAATAAPAAARPPLFRHHGGESSPVAIGGILEPGLRVVPGERALGGGTRDLTPRAEERVVRFQMWRVMLRNR